ncbi:MAG: potassium channel family protein [Bacteroidota bacterium]
MNKQDEKLGLLNILNAVLSLFVLGALVADTFWVLPEEESKILYILDSLICIFFLFDFLYLLITAKNKWEYMKWGWIDLLSSIPMIATLRAGRIIRLIRIIRIIRAFKSIYHLYYHVFKSKVKGAFTTVIVFSVLMIIFASISILVVEEDPQSNIKTAGDAIWWVFATITSVGYGDHYPITGEGRAIGIVLMIVGMGLFGTITGYIASWFVSEKAVEEKEEAK